MASGPIEVSSEPLARDDGRAALGAPRRARVGAFLAVALLHIVVILALIRAFAPDFTAATVDKVLSTFEVTVETKPPPPPPPAPEPSPAGKQGEEGKKAVAREVVAPKPKVVIAEKPAPRASSSGNADTSGARNTGAGTGAGGVGNGTGSGGAGKGSGGGAVSKAVKTAGDINSARDYPAATRDQRLGDYVIVVMTVGTDGRARDCRVRRASRDPQADAITCRLAEQRFRFKPATDAAGNPVISTFGWQQRWFVPGQTGT